MNVSPDMVILSFSSDQKIPKNTKKDLPQEVLFFTITERA